MQECFRDADGRMIFPSSPMNFKGPDGEFPVYWVWLFEQLGMAVPQDVPGTNPNGMYAFPGLVAVSVSLP